MYTMEKVIASEGSYFSNLIDSIKKTPIKENCFDRIIKKGIGQK